MVGKVIIKKVVTKALLIVLAACTASCGRVSANQQIDSERDTGEKGTEDTVYNEQLVDFFLSSLVNDHGMTDRTEPEEAVRKSSLNYNTDWKEKNGIADAAIADVDRNGSEDLIVVRFDRGGSEDTILCIVEVYACHENQVEAFGGDLIRKELPMAREESDESDVSTVLSVFLNEENELTVSWKYAKGKGTAPGQAFVRGGSVIYTFENETIKTGESSNWIT